MTDCEALKDFFELTALDEDQHLGLVPTNTPPGEVWVRRVELGQWAEAQDVLPGDRLVELNGRKVAEMAKADFWVAIWATRPLVLQFRDDADGQVLDELVACTNCSDDEARGALLASQNNAREAYMLLAETMIQNQ